MRGSITGSNIRTPIVIAGGLLLVLVAAIRPPLTIAQVAATGDAAQLHDDSRPGSSGAGLRALSPPVIPPTSELLIFLAAKTDEKLYAAANGLTVNYRLQSDPDAYVFIAASPAAAAQTLAKAANDPLVRQAWLNERTAYAHCAFVPNDPYFHRDTPVAGWKGQWHLKNEFVAGRDARVEGAWNRDVTGLGVTIGIVDDGIETAHSDLASNYIAGDSYDFGQNDANPNPVYSDDEHGISVAGVAAARGGNGIGVTGAAPYAGLAGLRISFPTQTTAMFVDATQYHSSGGNTSIKVKNHSYSYSYPYVPTPAERAALATSAAAGTIHCFAAGNDRNTTGEDSNKKHLQSSPDCIAVAAMGSDGKFASYSCFGANVFCCAPSGGIAGFGITTTDRTAESFGYNGGDTFPDSNYTSVFGGTSSAAPLVAGVLALAKQAQPGLNVRWAKHLLARTCTIVDAGDGTPTSDGGWKTNAAGDAGSYDCVVTNGCGSTVSSAAALTLGAGASLTLQPQSATACPGESVTFTVAASGADLTYQWRKDGVEVGGATSAGYTIASVAAGDLGTYDCIVTNACGSTTSNAAALTLGAGPMITTQPSAQSTCTGGSVSFTVVGSGATLTYQWRKDAIDIAGATAADFTIAAVSSADIGSYDCIITNGCGTTTSSAVTLSLGEGPSISTQPVRAATCVGGSAGFSIVVSGPAFSYQWRKNGVNIAGANSANYTITAATAADAGSYDCAVTNDCGTTTSAAAALIINRRGDANCDGDVNNFDIDAFVMALLAGRDAWQASYNCDYLCVLDVNRDGSMNNFDIDPFVDCVLNGCP